MSLVRLYLDEDAMHQGLVMALRARRVDVMSASEARMINRSDEEHLCWATQDRRVLYSFNIADYCILHQDWTSSGQTHGGIILAPQQRYSVGEQLRRLLLIVNRKSAENMQGHLEYLANWGR